MVGDLLQWILARIKQFNGETLLPEQKEIVGAFHCYEKGYFWLPKKNTRVLRLGNYSYDGT